MGQATCRCEGEGEGGVGDVLRDTVVLRPGSDVMDVFEALKRPPWNLVAGDFVRAECRLQGGQVSAARDAGVCSAQSSD